MMPNMPALGIRFNINDVGSGFYGIECWKVFWRAVDIQKLSGVLLFDGDTDATLCGREYVYCIAVQSNQQTVLDGIRASLEKNIEYGNIAASPKFVYDDYVVVEPLVFSGTIDSEGNISGVKSLPHIALDAIKKEQQRSVQISKPTEPSPAVRGQSTAQNKERQQMELCTAGKGKVNEEFEIKKLEEAKKAQEVKSIIKSPSEQKVPPEKKASGVKKPIFKNPAAFGLILLGTFTNLAIIFIGKLVDIGAVGYIFGLAALFICLFLSLVLILIKRT